MHLLTLREPLTVPGCSLDVGTYLVEDRNAWELAYLATPGSVSVDRWERPAQPEDLSGQRVLVIRPGGLGALMLVGCTIREMRRRWPTAALAVAAMGGGGEVYAGTSYAPEVEPYPVPAAVLTGYDAVIPMEGATEYGGDAHALHASDCFARAAGVDLGEESSSRVPEFLVSEGERESMAQRYPRSKRPRVAVQVFGSCAARSYALGQTKQVVNGLSDRGWECMLVGVPGSVPGENGKQDLAMGIWNCSADRLSFRETAGVVANCDAVLGPDSVWVHVAGAMGKPCVALFGSESWMHRTMHYERVRALTSGKCDLAPCHHWPRSPMDMPAGCPGLEDGVCVEMAGIGVDRIVGLVDALRP
jgi:ADP-heptose:LPS heptosyltransferase